jgi:hypothetical protein
MRGMDAQQLAATDQELQRLAFNLADALDTLNVHSRDEAVSGMRRDVFPISEMLALEIRRMTRALDDVRREYPSADTAALDADLGDMDALLNVLHKSAGEMKNYKEFVSMLIPLLRKCNEWGEQGPLSACGE